MEAVLGLVGTVITLTVVSWWVKSILDTVTHVVDTMHTTPDPGEIAALQEQYDKAYEQEPPITFDAIMAAMNVIGGSCSNPRLS